MKYVVAQNKGIRYMIESTEIKTMLSLKANGLDLYELIVNNKIVKGTLSHHIDELEEARDKALDINNLIWVSDKTHSYIHSEYNKNLENKNKMKEVLFYIIKNYYK